VVLVVLLRRRRSDGRALDELGALFTCQGRQRRAASSSSFSSITCHAT
jgi:hypothetical protein